MGKPLPYVPPSPFPLCSSSEIDSLLKYGACSSNAVNTDTEMRSVLATPPQWHVLLPHTCTMLIEATSPDFLIRLSVKQLPPSETDSGSKRRTYTLVPDGLQHPKFKGHDSHRGQYIVCRRAAIQEFDRRGTAPFITHSQRKAAALRKKIIIFKGLIVASCPQR